MARPPCVVRTAALCSENTNAVADPVPPEVIRPLKRAEYLKLAETGTFDGERVELLYGRLVTLSPQRERHAYSVTQLTHLLIRALGERARTRIQMPFLAPHESVPEPDVAVVPPGDYLDAHPAVAYLIVEVADSSLRVDRARLRSAPRPASPNTGS